MDTRLMNQVCPIHKIPLKDGKCPECEKEQSFSINQKKEIKKISIIKSKNTSHESTHSTQCPHCHTELSDSSLIYCPHCGKLIQPAPQLGSETKKEEKQGTVLRVIKQDGEEKILDLKYMTQPFGYYVKYRELEFLYSPINSILFVQNPTQQPAYRRIIRPFPIYNGQEFRIGKLPFLLHYSDTTQAQGEGGMRTLMVGRDITLDSQYAIDCLECTYPNFPGIIINLNEDKIVLDRDGLVKEFRIQDEQIFTRLGVSSRSIELRRIHDLWYLFPRDNPNVFIKIPGYFIPLYPEMEMIVDQIHITLNIE